MYKKHPLLSEPKNSLQKLWRYLKYERLLEVINEGSLYFPHITKMTDKWEGLLTARTKDNLFRQQYSRYRNAEAARGSVETYEQHKDNFYINCWHMNDHESYLMWKVYGDRECAIQTTYERLTASFGDEHPEINGCVITYIDYDRDHFPIGNIVSAVSFKDLPYRDEKEFRLLYSKIWLANQDYPVDENGVKIQVDIKMLIENIYLNPSKELNIQKLFNYLKTKQLSLEKVNYSRIKE